MTDSLRTIATADAALERAHEELRSAVAHAREEGATWQQIAQVLGVSRQAAFQRFGTPADQRSGQDAPTADVAALATWAVARLAAGQYDELRSRMTQTCARQLTRHLLDEVWQQVLEEVGQLEEAHDATNHDPRGGELSEGQVPLPAVGRVELAHETGELWCHVVVNRSGRITGMVIRPGEVPESWPL